MKIRHALISAAILLATPALAQSGSVTYQVNIGDVRTVTVNYTNRTVTTTYTNGFNFTQVDGPDFDFNAAAGWYEQTYSDQTPDNFDGH